VAALGRAHSLLAQNRWEGGDLSQIVTEETAAYQRPGQVEARGPAVILNANAVQPVSLLVHELATNAVKYGSLSVDAGHVNVNWSLLANGHLQVRWTETGGPAVTEREGEVEGFGSTLVREVMRRQLGGSLDLQWPASGLLFTATLPPNQFRLDFPTAHAPAHEGDPGASKSAAAGRLLIVEDEALIAMELSADLTALGWQIIGPAATMDEARRLIASDTPDAALLDINLSGTLVYPLADQLAARGVPIVFCTGYEQIEGAAAFRGALMVRKPVNIAVLDGQLRRARAVA
jgi:CheY-like chemotaxis protein